MQRNIGNVCSFAFLSNFNFFDYLTIPLAIFFYLPPPINDAAEYQIEHLSEKEDRKLLNDEKKNTKELLILKREADRIFDIF